MLYIYTGLDIDEHSSLKGSWAGLLESTILLEEQFQEYSQIFRAAGHQIILEI